MISDLLFSKLCQNDMNNSVENRVEYGLGRKNQGNHI